MKDLATDIEDIIKRSENSGKNTQQVIEEFSTQYRRKIEMAKSQKVISVQKYEEWSEVFNSPAFKQDPKGFMQAILRSDHSKNYKAAGNISRNKSQISNQAIAMIFQEVDKFPGLQKRLMRGDIDVDRQLYAYLHDGVTKGIDEGVLAVAKAIKKTNNHMFSLKRGAGFGTRYLDTFIAPTKHSVKAMRELEELPWIALAKDTFDRMNIAPDKIDEYLTTFYQKRLASEGQSFFKFVDPFVEIVTNSVSERLGKRRSVHFKSGDKAFEYNKAMGGKSLYERMLDGVKKDAGNIASAQMLGPNAKATWTRLLLDAQKKVNKKGERLNSKDVDRLNNFYKFVVEGDAQPEMNMVARFGDKLKKFTDMSKLGTALFTTATDFAYATGIFSGNTGRGFLNSQNNVVKEFFKTFVSEAQQKKIATKLRVFAEDVNSLSLDHRFGDYSDGTGNTGLIDKAHELFMRATGLPRQARSMRLAIAKLLSSELAEKSNLKHSELFPGMQKGMDKFGIGENKWDILRQATDDFGDGTRGITPEKIHALEDGAFSNHPDIVKLRNDFKAKGKTTKAAEAAFEHKKNLKIENIKNDLSTSYSGYLSELAEVGSPTPGAEQAFWKSNFVGDRNSVTGQLLRFTLQYKSFAMAQFKTMQAVTNTDAKFQTTASTVIAAAGWGYVALAMKDIMKGREPRDPSDPKTWVESFIQSGAGLIYTDFLTTEYNKSYRSMAKDLAGPVISGLGNDVSVLFAKAVRGDLSAIELLRKIERNTPSIFMTKAALNKNIYETLYRVLNMKQRKSKKYKNFYSVYD